MKKIVSTVSKLMSFVAQMVLLIVMLLITFDVFGRYFLEDKNYQRNVRVNGVRFGFNGLFRISNYPLA